MATYSSRQDKLVHYFGGLAQIISQNERDHSVNVNDGPSLSFLTSALQKFPDSQRLYCKFGLLSVSLPEWMKLKIEGVVEFWEGDYIVFGRVSDFAFRGGKEVPTPFKINTELIGLYNPQTKIGTFFKVPCSTD